MSLRVTSGPPQPQGYGEDPLAHYTNVFIRFLQILFEDFDPGNYKWLPDENASEIIITDQSPIAREAVEKVPHIVVMRGPMQQGNIVLNDFKGYDSHSGRRDYTDLISATMTFNCLSKVGREAQRLASITRMMVQRLKRDLLRGGNIHHIGPISMGSESGPGSLVSGGTGDAGIIVVQTTVPFYYQDFWSVEPADKLLLKGVDVRVTSQSLQPTLRPPSMNGVPLQVEKIFSITDVKVSRLTAPKPRK